MLPEIKNPEDWYTVDLMLKNMVRSMPEFRHDYNKLVNNIQTKINELSKIDIEIRRKSSAGYEQKRTEKLREINDAIRLFSKFHLLASLSKR
jgi:hypothetical protein